MLRWRVQLGRVPATPLALSHTQRVPKRKIMQAEMRSVRPVDSAQFPHTFALETESRTYYVQAGSADECQDWIAQLK